MGLIPDKHVSVGNSLDLDDSKFLAKELERSMKLFAQLSGFERKMSG